MRLHFKEKIMDLEKIEKKFRANYQFSNARESGSGGFILSDGSVMPTPNHERTCKNMGTKLADVLEVGVCRYMFRIGQQGNVAAFEYHSLTPEQKITIRKMLKNDDYFTVVTEKTTTNSFRPVRNLNF
ncbi:hypothetical protein LCGC14_0653410 [marine sediment metagenome]|uniref:Uncharacterized protein n=2 Tax=marine sediment metagenome TaxID=412755 RepID=A0A0F9R0X2_9ZZZZ